MAGRQPRVLELATHPHTRCSRVRNFEVPDSMSPGIDQAEIVDVVQTGGSHFFPAIRATKIRGYSSHPSFSPTPRPPLEELVISPSLIYYGSWSSRSLGIRQSGAEPPVLCTQILEQLPGTIRAYHARGPPNLPSSPQQSWLWQK